MEGKAPFPARALSLTLEPSSFVLGTLEGIDSGLYLFSIKLSLICQDSTSSVRRVAIWRSTMTKYYDIDDIITEEEIVSVIFQKAASGVGIDPSSETDYIETGSKVELPFWLAHELQLRQVVSINIPPCFDQKTRLEIQADCASVDLRSRCPFFYEFGCKIAPVVGDRTIGFLLLSAFKNRYKEVLTKAHTAAFSAATKFWSILTNEEINLYEAAQSSMASFKKWRIGGPRFQKAPVLGRKRKSSE